MLFFSFFGMITVAYLTNMMKRIPIIKGYPIKRPLPSLCKSSLCEETGLENKKLISLSPGGLKGFYMLGTITYIKEHYALDDFIFSGASAGAWNALILTFKEDPIELILETLEDTKKAISIRDLEYRIKYKILQKYTAVDFDLGKLYIGVTNIENLRIKTRIYSNFTSLEDALDCCIASSHIPYITGGFKNIYNDVYSFDGGFSHYPYVSTIRPSLHITPNVWGRIKNKSKRQWSNFLEDYTTLFSKDNYDFMQLFDYGYEDAKKNKMFLDGIFLNDKDSP